MNLEMQRWLGIGVWVAVAVAALAPSASCPTAGAAASNGSAPAPPATPRKLRRSIGFIHFPPGEQVAVVARGRAPGYDAA